MTSSAPSGRLQNAIKYYIKVCKTGPKCRKGLKVRNGARYDKKISVLQRQRRLSNFSSEEYRQSFRIKRSAFRLVPHYGGFLVFIALGTTLSDKIALCCLTKIDSCLWWTDFSNIPQHSNTMIRMRCSLTDVKLNTWLLRPSVAFLWGGGGGSSSYYGQMTSHPAFFWHCSSSHVAVCLMSELRETNQYKWTLGMRDVSIRMIIAK